MLKDAPVLEEYSWEYWPKGNWQKWWPKIGIFILWRISYAGNNSEKWNQKKQHVLSVWMKRVNRHWLCAGCCSSSLWTSLMAGEPPSLLTTGAAALAASTHRPRLCRSAAAAAAATHPAPLPSAPRNPRTAALAQQRIYSMIVIKVRMGSST